MEENMPEQRHTLTLRELDRRMKQLNGNFWVVPNLQLTALKITILFHRQPNSKKCKAV
jgi:hypothetical protein